MGPADTDPQPGSADRGTGGHAGGGRDRMTGRDDQEAITRSRQLIARSAAGMDRCEALLRRQAQRASQEQSATDREIARSRRDAGP
jgi:hypothetical protein